jgi:type VI secretion system protein VasD
MTIHHPRTAVLSIVVAVAAAISCAKAPPPAAPPAPMTITVAPAADTKVKTVMTIAASADANPDVNGRPSPVVLHVYQLKADAAFNSAEFFALVDDHQKVLGDSLVSHDEFFVRPAEQRPVDVSVAKDAAFLGIVAEFREYRTASWRAIGPSPRAGFTVAVERAKVSVK